MQNYINQLLADISYATENISLPFVEKQLELHDWISEEEEDKTAPVRNLEEWTGVSKDMLPPQEMLSDEQLQQLLKALNKMLDAYNWSFVMQTTVPDRFQYTAIRDNFNQPAKVKQWHMGFFEICRPGTEHGKCALGEYCQCAFFAELFKDMIDEDLTPEEERARALEIELKHIKRKYGDDWMKYYPYHLDPTMMMKTAIRTIMGLEILKMRTTKKMITGGVVKKQMQHGSVNMNLIISPRSASRHKQLSPVSLCTKLFYR